LKPSSGLVTAFISLSLSQMPGVMRLLLSKILLRTFDLP
jgi:hypothetical protein